MKYIKSALPLILIWGIILFSGCKKKENPVDTPPETPAQNESEFLAKYLEANADYINSANSILLTAQEVRDGQLNKTKQFVFDLRNECDFHTLGHIEGALLIKAKDIPWYYRNHNLENMTRVIITCGTGQEASYTAMVLKYYGYTNVYGMMWGMTSWNSRCDMWTKSIGDNRASQFVKNNAQKNKAGSLPEINTGKTKAQDILFERAKLVLTAQFQDAAITRDSLFNNLQSFYIINYVPVDSYTAGHVPGSVQYTPQQDMKLATYLKTLPNDKPIAIYCSTGQTSAQLAAFLKVLGYNAKTVLFGCNGMNYSNMIGKKFTASEIHDFPYIN